MIDLSQYQELIFRQSKEMLEVFTDFETANRYRILTPAGEEIMYAYEESGMISRQFMGSHRPLNLHVVDTENRPVLNANRKFFWYFSHLNVADGEGNPIGVLSKLFAMLKRKFSVLDANGQQIAGINGSILHRYTFTVNDHHGEEVGRITKEWSGVMREAFTDADTFSIKFSDNERSQEFRLMLIAAAFAIDMDFFERSGSR